MNKLLASILIITIVICGCVCLVGCDDDTVSLSIVVEWHFDLSDEKICWEGSVEENFADDGLIVIFKKCKYGKYPILEVKDLKYDNAESISYLMDAPSKNNTHSDDFRQIAWIRLKERGKDKVVEAIEYFSRVSIVYCAEPNYFGEAGDDSLL